MVINTSNLPPSVVGETGEVVQNDCPRRIPVDHKPFPGQSRVQGPGHISVFSWAADPS